MLYESLAGRHPFAAPTIAGMLRRIAEEPAGTDLDPTWNDIFTRALAAEPSKRFASASELRTALQRLSS